MGKDNRRKTTKEVAAILAREEYRLLSPYKNARQKLKVCCPFDHEYEVAWFNFKSGDRCPECRKKKMREHLQKDIREIERALETEGFSFAHEIKYKNAHQRIQLICPRSIFLERAGNIGSVVFVAPNVTSIRKRKGWERY